MLVAANFWGLVLLFMDGPPAASEAWHHYVIGGWFAAAGAVCGLLVPRHWWIGSLAGLVGLASAVSLVNVDRPLAAGYEVLRTLGLATLSAFLCSRPARR